MTVDILAKIISSCLKKIWGVLKTIEYIQKIHVHDKTDKLGHFS